MMTILLAIYLSIAALVLYTSFPMRTLKYFGNINQDPCLQYMLEDS